MEMKIKKTKDGFERVTEGWLRVALKTDGDVRVHNIFLQSSSEYYVDYTIFEREEDGTIREVDGGVLEKDFDEATLDEVMDFIYLDDKEYERSNCSVGLLCYGGEALSDYEEGLALLKGGAL